MSNPVNKNNVVCWKGWHTRAIVGTYYYPDGSRACRECSRISYGRRDPRPRVSTYGALMALWNDGEYAFLRGQGLTPQAIGERHGVKWESFQRTLWRRLGTRSNW